MDKTDIFRENARNRIAFSIHLCLLRSESNHPPHPHEPRLFPQALQKRNGGLPPEISHADPYLPREASPASEATVGHVHPGDRVAFGLPGQLVFFPRV